MRARLALGFLLGAALVLLVANLALNFFAHRASEQRARVALVGAMALTRAQFKNTSLSQISREQWQNLGAKLETQSNRNLANNDEGFEAWLINAEGKVVWRSRDSAPRFPPRPLRFRERDSGFRDRNRDARPDFPNSNLNPSVAAQIEARRRRRAARLPDYDNSNAWRALEWRESGARLVIGVPFYRAANALNERSRALAWLSAGMLILLAPTVFWMVGRALKPIGNLAAQARRETARGLEARLSPSSSDAEIEELAATLNALLERASNASRAQSRFHTAASHELRTPLAGLSGLLEVTLSRPRETAEYQNALENALEQTRRLTELTHDLLLLNRLQTGAARPPGEVLDVADIADQILTSFAASISEKSLKTRVELRDLQLEAPPSHVEALLRNLLENAVKYGENGGELRVATREKTLDIWNQNLSAAPDEDWFEPFFRPDAARDSQTGGNGLGLAICRALCDFHGWKLDVSRQNDGILARVEFTPAP